MFDQKDTYIINPLSVGWNFGGQQFCIFIMFWNMNVEVCSTWKFSSKAVVKWWTL